MPKKGDVHVVPSDKGWRVEIEGTGGARSTHKTQVEAAQSMLAPGSIVDEPATAASTVAWLSVSDRHATRAPSATACDSITRAPMKRPPSMIPNSSPQNVGKMSANSIKVVPRSCRCEERRVNQARTPRSICLLVELCV